MKHPMIRHADISECGQYRYRLERMWDVSVFNHLVYIMLNPSTADGLKDDPTIRRCCSIAKGLGFGGIYVVNLFAYRATDPKKLKLVDFPIGPDNDSWLLAVGQKSTVVAAWGTHGTLYGRDKEVLRLLKSHKRKVYCLGITKKGHPKHPLYLPATVQLLPFQM